MNSLVVKRLSSSIDDILFSNMLFHGFEVGISIFFKLREEWRYFVFCRRPRYQDHGLGWVLGPEGALDITSNPRNLFGISKQYPLCRFFARKYFNSGSLLFEAPKHCLVFFPTLLSFMDPVKTCFVLLSKILFLPHPLPA